MKKIYSILIAIILFNSFINAEIITGKIDHNDINYKNKIIDSKTNSPISNARITIPELNYTTYSNKDGIFKLDASIDSKTVLFVEKEGYKVFSLTVDNNVLKSPLKLGIEKSSPLDIQTSVGIIHLGDNMFSNNSANSNDFKSYANGANYIVKFNHPNTTSHQDIVVKIGTIIGLDTKRAKDQGQNRISRVYSSPMLVFVNEIQIGKIELNGDNIEIKIPKQILKETNELRITTGQNLFQTEYVDYDDVELANIRIETKSTYRWVKH